MKHVKYGIRSWDNDSIKTCVWCGKGLTDHYIRVNSFYFCSMVADEAGFSAKCFSEWALNRFPNQIAKRMIGELPTPEMQS
jgi:hypothetical protein